MAEGRVSCAVCGTTVDEKPVTWSMQVSARGSQSLPQSLTPPLPQWLCERCTRDNVRSIEGKLDEAWW